MNRSFSERSEEVGRFFWRNARIPSAVYAADVSDFELLRAFHDFVWKNGNVPISLQRWEYLGKDDDVPK